MPVLILCIVEAASYYGRVWLSHGKDNFSAYVLYALLNIPAPVFLSMTIYLTLSRIMRALKAEEHAMIRPKAITTIFVINDVICFCLQIAGVGLQATTDASVREIGGHVVLGGMIFQILVFLWFVLIAVKFHRRNLRAPSYITRDPRTPGWPKHLWVLYVASFCVIVRNLVRAIEYAQGGGGSISSNEVYLYVFDGALMFIVTAIYIVVHPGVLLRKIRKTRPGDVEVGESKSMQKKRAKKEGKQAKKEAEKGKRPRRSDEMRDGLVEK